MDIRKLPDQYLPSDNSFYRDHYHHVLASFMMLTVLIMILLAFIIYQILNRPTPTYRAIKADGQSMVLYPYYLPNQMPSTILRWAGKAATIAYTFDFANYQSQIAAARPYFTESGWQDYLNSLEELIRTIRAKQLTVNGVVSGTPVIANEGDLTGHGYSWRVQIPFLVTYTSGELPVQKDYLVTLLIVKVPTSTNAAGIGIDQFTMA